MSMFQPNTPYGQMPAKSPLNQSRRRDGRRGCLLWLALLVLLGGGAWLLYQYLQNTPSAASFLVNFFSSSTFTILAVIGGVLLVVVVILAGVLRRTVLGKLLRGVALVMVMVGLVGILLFTSLNPHIGLTRTGFSTTSISMYIHNKVTFDNPRDGVTQILCLGVDQQCERRPQGGAPSQLEPGLVIHPGQSVSIAFDHEGLYPLTSKNTPHMNLKISVVSFAHNKVTFQNPADRVTQIVCLGTDQQEGGIKAG